VLVYSGDDDITFPDPLSVETRVMDRDASTAAIKTPSDMVYEKISETKRLTGEPVA
jgi:hypothetical protein